MSQQPAMPGKTAQNRDASRVPQGPGSRLLRARFWLPWLCLALLASAGARADTAACLTAHEQAQIERLHGRYLEARAQLLLCVQDACPGVVRSDCKGWLQGVDSSLASVVFAIADSSGRDLVDVRISADSTLLSEHADGRALVLNPGVYNMRFEALGHAPQAQQLTVREGEKQRIVRITLSPEVASAPAATDSASREASGSATAHERPRRLLLTGYALSGVALASLVTGIVVGALGKKKLDELRHEHCKPDCPQNEVNAGLHKYYAANAMFALGGAVAVAAAVTLTLGLRASKRDRPASAEVGLDRHGLTLGLRAVF